MRRVPRSVDIAFKAALSLTSPALAPAAPAAPPAADPARAQAAAGTACAADALFNAVAKGDPNAYALDSGKAHWRKKDPCDPAPFLFTYGWGGNGSYENHIRYEQRDDANRKVNLVIDGAYTATPPNDEMKRLIESAMRDMERVANVRFVPYAPGIVSNVLVQNPNRPMFVFNAAHLEPLHLGGSTTTGDDWTQIFLADYLGRSPAEEGSYAWRLARHELGHGVKLKHPNLQTEGNRIVLPEALDNENFSLMSDQDSDPSSKGGMLSLTQDPSVPPTQAASVNATYRVLDIAELQNLFGANWKYNPENKPYALTGALKLWTVWNGREPGIFDARAYTGSAPVLINLTPGIVDTPTRVGDEHVDIAEGTVIRTAYGATNAPNRFIGSPAGGSVFIGGERENDYEFSGSGNDATAPACSTGNLFTFRPGAQATLHGFDPARDRIAFLPSSARIAPAVSLSGRNLIVENGGTRITLADFRGDPTAIAFAAATPPATDAAGRPWAERAAASRSTAPHCTAP